jgi:beta-galactosidase
MNRAYSIDTNKDENSHASSIRSYLKNYSQMKTLYKIFPLIIFLFLSIPISVISQKASHTFEIKDGNFLYDGQPIQIHSGEMHYPRVPHEYWRHRFKMMRAMGLNAVATCVFWNYHNTAPGVWDFTTGNHNLAEYIRTAQEEGLFVILRPGPYVCAEWEYGGYPWWLTKNKDLIVRGNGAFLDSCNTYIKILAAQIKNLQITHGGPIIMVQVENEFGSYVSQQTSISRDDHQKYYLTIKKMLEQTGFDVPFFTSDGSWVFESGAIPGVLPTANGEGDIENLVKCVNKYNSGKGPYMVAEYYPGWLDHWGEPFVKVATTDVIKQLEKYLQNNINFSFYMVHGGTNFGFTSGANFNDGHDIQPDITSYDYDAPISESGSATPKYLAIRDLMQKYSAKTLPSLPEPIPTIKIKDITFKKTANLFNYKNLIKPKISDKPLTFEELNQGYGYVLYSRHFTKPIKGKLSIPGLRDFATLYVNNKKIGVLNRATNTYSIDIDIPMNGTLDIFTENMGRINYGAQIINNTKGITSGIHINDSEIIGNWEMYPFPMETAPDLKPLKSSNNPGLPTLYYGTFEISKTGDTFLNFTNWGKGIVFINGHNIGRYWNIGPQQTLYLPGCWLKKGKNEIIVFEQLNEKVQQFLSTQETPELNNLILSF